MGFASIKELVDAELDGKVRHYTFRKTPTQASVAKSFFDLSMSPGIPLPNYYIGSPFVAKTLTYSADSGIFHGANVSPSEKYLRSITVMANAATALPMNLTLCDYLLFYPFIDTGTTDEQFLDNTQTLTRYETGASVQVMAVITNPGAGGQQFYINYTNSDGTAARISQTVTMSTLATVTGTVITGFNTTAGCEYPFIPLQSGDTGVRSIESVTMLGADFGLFSLVLVKTLAQICVREITAACEKDFFLNSLDIPRIYDDAYLNFVGNPQGTLAATAIMGDLKVVFT